MSRWLPRLARLAYWMACSSALCLVWMAIAFPAAHPKHLPPISVQIIWWALCLYAPASILIGIISWAWIRLRLPHRQGSTFAEAAIAVGLSSCAVIFCGTTVLMSIREDFHSNLGGGFSCYSREKQLSLALQMYVQDYDEQYPLASSWNATTMPYSRNESEYRCPQEYDRSVPSYGMNRLLAQAQSSQIAAPEKVIMLIDAAPGANRVVGKTDFPFTDRHEPYLHVAFADGHAKSIIIDKVLNLTWELSPVQQKPTAVKKKR